MLLPRPKRPRVVSDPTRFRNGKNAGNGFRNIFFGGWWMDLMMLMLRGVIFLLFSRFFLGGVDMFSMHICGGVIYMRFEESNGLKPTARWCLAFLEIWWEVKWAVIWGFLWPVFSVFKKMFMVKWFHNVFFLFVCLFDCLVCCLFVWLFVMHLILRRRFNVLCCFICGPKRGIMKPIWLTSLIWSTFKIGLKLPYIEDMKSTYIEA